MPTPVFTESLKSSQGPYGRFGRGRFSEIHAIRPVLAHHVGFRGSGGDGGFEGNRGAHPLESFPRPQTPKTSLQTPWKSSPGVDEALPMGTLLLFSAYGVFLVAPLGHASGSDSRLM